MDIFHLLVDFKKGFLAIIDKQNGQNWYYQLMSHAKAYNYHEKNEWTRASTKNRRVPAYFFDLISRDPHICFILFLHLWKWDLLDPHILGN